MKYAGFLVLCFFFSDCGLDNSYYVFRNYEKDLEQTATIGSPMIDQGLEYRNNVYNRVLERAESQLIYSGKAGNVIKIVYREFSNDMARPAFSQEVQYDLNDTTVIKFKHTTIQVLKATNQEITFRVLDAPSLQYKQGKISKQDVDRMREQK